MARLKCDTCGAVNNVRRGMAPEEQSLPDTNTCHQCGGEIGRAGGALWRPVPSRPPITRLCCLKCGVENAVFTPTSNICIGCGKALFRLQHPKSSKTGEFMGTLLSVLWYGGWGIAMLVVGGWWVIGLGLLILYLPVYALFDISPVLGVISVLAFAAWLLHRMSRPEAVARRRQRQQRQRIRRELKSVGDDLPI
jgi:hypothetical protein